MSSTAKALPSRFLGSRQETASGKDGVDSLPGGQYPLAMEAAREHILVARAHEGDAASFEELVLSHTPRILNLAFRLVGDRDEAEDIAQEAFLRLHRSLGTFRGESRIGTWLYRTVTRLGIDHLRREKLKRNIFFFRRGEEDADPVETAPDHRGTPRDLLLAKEMGIRLRRALDRLSARQRTIFSLRHFEELPLKEIAGLLGLEEGTVKAHLHRALTALRRELKESREETL